jgi:hypothetical protein
MARSEPLLETDPETGEERQVWRKHAVTGEPLVAKRRPVVYDETKIFYMESQGNGNVAMVPWKPPSPEELAGRRRNGAKQSTR